MSDIDLDDIRQKLLGGTPAPGAYDHNDDDEEDGPDETTSTQSDPSDGPVADAQDDTSTPRSVNPVLQSYLDDKLQLQQAQSQAKQNQNSTGLASALVQLTHGIARAPGSADLSGVQSLAKNDNAPIENALASQKVGDQIAQAQDQNDPDSDASQTFRKSLKLVAPKIAEAYGDSFDNITAADAPNIMKTVDLKAQIDQRAQAAKDRSDALNDNRQARLDASSSRADAKSSADQDKQYTNLRKDLESFRGNKQVAQAAQDVYSAQKALEIVKNKDPNSLTTQDLSLLSNEMAKIASGGVPGEHGVQQLMPNNLQTKLADLKGFIASKPTDAQAGDYVKKNMQYLQGMTQEAQKSVNSYRQNILKGYQHRIKPEDFQAAQQDYGLGAQVAPPASAHPEAEQAMAWAKNPQSPGWTQDKANTILQRLGGINTGAAL